MDVRQETKDFGDKLRDRSNDLARTGKDTILREVDRFSSAFHSSADKLQAEHDPFAGWVNNASSQLDRFAGYLRNREPSDLYRDVENVARNNIGLTIGSMLTAGVVLSRFLKSGIDNRR